MEEKKTLNEFDLIRAVGGDEAFLSQLLWWIDTDTLQELCENIAEDNQIYDEILVSNLQDEEV